jgi:hypothetical protein
MDAGSTDWYREAAEAVLRPLGDAESHFDSAYSHREKTALSEACDRLSRAARQAESWSAGNPCPSSDTEFHLRDRVKVCRMLVEVVSAVPVRPGLADRVDFQVADLQHKLLWHRDAIATWAAE